jgi:hypothetical protein
MYYSSLYWSAVGQMEVVLTRHFDDEHAREQAFAEIVSQYSPYLCKEDAEKLNNVTRSTYKRFQWRCRKLGY